MISQFSSLPSFLIFFPSLRSCLIIPYPVICHHSSFLAVCLCVGVISYHSSLLSSLIAFLIPGNLCVWVISHFSSLLPCVLVAVISHHSLSCHLSHIPARLCVWVIRHHSSFLTVSLYVGMISYHSSLLSSLTIPHCCHLLAFLIVVIS